MKFIKSCKMLVYTTHNEVILQGHMDRVNTVVTSLLTSLTTAVLLEDVPTPEDLLLPPKKVCRTATAWLRNDLLLLPTLPLVLTAPPLVLTTPPPPPSTATAHRVTSVGKPWLCNGQSLQDHEERAGSRVRGRRSQDHVERETFSCGFATIQATGKPDGGAHRSSVSIPHETSQK